MLFQILIFNSITSLLFMAGQMVKSERIFGNTVTLMIGPIGFGVLYLLMIRSGDGAFTIVPLFGAVLICAPIILGTVTKNLSEARRFKRLSNSGVPTILSGLIICNIATFISMLLWEYKLFGLSMLVFLPISLMYLKIAKKIRGRIFPEESQGRTLLSFLENFLF